MNRENEAEDMCKSRPTSFSFLLALNLLALNLEFFFSLGYFYLPRLGELDHSTAI